MATPTERNWTAHLVISSEHAGLRPYFKELELAMYKVLARVDEPRHVRYYLERLREASREWLREYEAAQPQK